MVNPKNAHGINLHESTYSKLKSLKHGEDTFDDVISKLIMMDRKYKFYKTIEYEFETENISKSFKIIFEGNHYTISYWGKNSFEDNISAWDNYPPISKEDKDKFIRFIIMDKNIHKLKNLVKSEDFGEFIIYKLD